MEWVTDDFFTELDNDVRDEHEQDSQTKMAKEKQKEIGRLFIFTPCEEQRCTRDISFLGVVIQYVLRFAPLDGRNDGRVIGKVHPKNVSRGRQ